MMGAYKSLEDVMRNVEPYVWPSYSQSLQTLIRKPDGSMNAGFSVAASIGKNAGTKCIIEASDGDIAAPSVTPERLQREDNARRPTVWTTCIHDPATTGRSRSIPSRRRSIRGRSDKAWLQEEGTSSSVLLDRTYSGYVACSKMGGMKSTYAGHHDGGREQGIEGGECPSATVRAWRGAGAAGLSFGKLCD
ncbi:hypothetical protein PENSPDRAFT_192107 [Peniophora sp. CONT]|nr:hypothetical protein PENSPDRAFT_192107 [Peniophora sp. CONT]